MDRESRFTLILVLVGGSLAGYGAFTNTGPVGWLNALEQMVFGGYYPLISFAIVFLGFIVIGALVLGAIEKQWKSGASNGVMKQLLWGPKNPEQGVNPGVSNRSIWVIFATIILLTWAAGFAYYAWTTWTLKADASASYSPVLLTDGQPAAMLGTHWQLRAIPIPESMLVERSDDSSPTEARGGLVAVVGAGWQPGHLVPMVLKLDADDDIAALSNAVNAQLRDPREVQMYVRRASAIPAPALQVFKDNGYALSPEAVMVTPVAVQDGKPFLPDTSAQWLFMLAICGLLTFLNVVFFFAARHGARKNASMRGQN